MESSNEKKPTFFVVPLGAGDVMIQDSDVEVAENGPQVQIDFFKHKRRHSIGDFSTDEEVKVEEDWEYLGCIGSNSVKSLDVLIERITQARDKLKQAVT